MRAARARERAQYTVVAVVALQDDADERRRRSAAGGAELVRYRFAFGGIEFGERLACETREMVERLPNQRGVAAERREHVGLDRGVVSAGHLVRIAGGNDHRGDGAEVVALGWTMSSFIADMAASIEEVGKALLHLVGNVERDRLDGRGWVDAT